MVLPCRARLNGTVTYRDWIKSFKRIYSTNYALFKHSPPSVVERTSRARRDMSADEKDFSLKLNTALLDDSEIYGCYVFTPDNGGKYSFERLFVFGTYNPTYIMNASV